MIATLTVPNNQHSGNHIPKAPAGAWYDIELFGEYYVLAASEDWASPKLRREVAKANESIHRELKELADNTRNAANALRDSEADYSSWTVEALKQANSRVCEAALAMYHRQLKFIESTHQLATKVIAEAHAREAELRDEANRIEIDGARELLKVKGGNENDLKRYQAEIRQGMNYRQAMGKVSSARSNTDFANRRIASLAVLKAEINSRLMKLAAQFIPAGY